MGVLLHLLSGVALLVWGTNIVKVGILRVYGANLRHVLSASVSNRFKAFAAGLGVTGLVQSSNATAVIVSSFVGQGLIAVAPALAIMLGANTEVTPERMAELRARIGLDKPIPVQYLSWIGAALQADFGRSLWTGRPVLDEIAVHVWPTLQLTLLALAIGAGLAVPAGCLMAKLRGRLADGIMRVVTVVGLTVPNFWLGIVMILALATLAPSVQALGYVPFTQAPLDSLARLSLPAIALALQERRG